MARIDQSQLAGKIRDRPIAPELEAVLSAAADAAGIDTVLVTSGGQPGSAGRSTGSTRHNGGRAADLQLLVGGKPLIFDDTDAPDRIEAFVTAAAAAGANGIGAGVDYMGPRTLHVGFGLDANDQRRIVWGAGGRSAMAPGWLRAAAERGWKSPALAGGGAAIEIRREEDEDEDGTVKAPAEPLDIPPRFNAAVVAAAQATQRRLGIPASITLAQWALESAFGTRMPPGSNNPFGIKARAGEPEVSAVTIEVEDGRKVSVVARFRKFSSLDEAFEAHGRLLAFGRPYAAARKVLPDPNRFADALTGVYATDPQYGTLLKSIMRSNDLYRFDDAAGPIVVRPEFSEETLTMATAAAVRLDGATVEKLQRQLVDLGYFLGKIDGKFGSLTAGALLSFQHDNGLPTTGLLDEATQEAFLTAKPRELSLARVKATEQDLKQGGSRIVRDAAGSRVLSWVTGLLGALGVGNSAVVNAQAPTAGTPLPETLLPFLAEVQRLSPATAAPDFTRIADAARALAAQVGHLGLPPDALQALARLRAALPPDALARNPDLGRLLGDLAGPPTATPAMRTVFDLLPGLFANDTVLQTAMKGVAAVGASVVPGFGGSLAMLGLGLAGRFLANRIAAARVEDHATGANIRNLS